jgi:hypothetical protein
MPTLSIHGDIPIPGNIIHTLGFKPSAEPVFEGKATQWSCVRLP